MIETFVERSNQMQPQTVRKLPNLPFQVWQVLCFPVPETHDGALGRGPIRARRSTGEPALVFWEHFALSAASTVLVPEDAAATASRGHRASGVSLVSLVAHRSREDVELDSAARADQATDHRANDRENIRCCHRRVPDEQCRRRCQYLTPRVRTLWLRGHLAGDYVR